MPIIPDLIESKRVIACLGSGGVGKTTISAAVAIAAAARGKRVLVLTIDPAKRLADSLGVSLGSGEPQVIETERLLDAGLTDPGELSVMMLDAKRTFDALVVRHASSPAVSERILGNVFYQHMSEHLGGTQDYMAMETLLGFLEDDRYELIVLDTPPTRNALDFLTAPERLTDAIDGPAMRWFVKSFDGSKTLSFDLLAKGAALVLRGMGRITGSGFLDQMAALIVDLNDLFGGFSERAGRVSARFRGDEFAYVLVSAPKSGAISEALYLREHLQQQSMSCDAFVMNRVRVGAGTTTSLAEVEQQLSESNVALEGGEEAVLQAIRENIALAEAEAVQVSAFRERIGSEAPMVAVPAGGEDVHDLSALVEVASAFS